MHRIVNGVVLRSKQYRNKLNDLLDCNDHPYFFEILKDWRKFTYQQKDVKIDDFELSRVRKE